MQGDDVAGALRSGELAPAGALIELTALAATGDPDGELAALAIARALEPLIAEPVRPRFTAWLAARFARRLTRAALIAPRSPVERAVRSELVELVADAVDPASSAAMRQVIARRRSGATDQTELLIAAAHGGDALFDRITAAAAGATAAERSDLLGDLGAFPADDAARIADLAFDPRFTVAQVWPALAAQLARSATRSAAWRAIHHRFAAGFAALPDAVARDLVSAAAELCDATARAELSRDTAPLRAVRSAFGRGLGPAIDRALAEIDRCIARRAAAGDLAPWFEAPPP